MEVRKLCSDGGEELSGEKTKRAAGAPTSVDLLQVDIVLWASLFGLERKIALSFQFRIAVGRLWVLFRFYGAQLHKSSHFIWLGLWTNGDRGAAN